MRIVIIGAGPAGLYVSLLLKRSGSGHSIEVFEQNAPSSTFGFGVVFSEGALEFLKEDDPAKLRAAMEALGTYPSEALNELQPLFVSRAVSKRGGGELHAATLRAVADSAPTTALEKVPLSKLNLAKLERMVGRYDPRNLATYELLRNRLIAAGDDAKKAFGSAAGSVRKPSAADKSAPPIRSIRIEVTQNSGLLVRGGIADLGEMAFVDVFKVRSGYTLAPRYAAEESRVRGVGALPSNASYCFSLRKNDLVEIDVSGHRFRAYFVMYESDGRVTLRAHDQPLPDKKFFRRSIAKATLLRKLNVDILGQTFAARVEQPHGLA